METLNKLLEVIDNNSQDMPEGVYLQLMNLLRDQHKELKDKDNEIKEEIKELNEFSDQNIRIWKKLREENTKLKEQIIEKDYEILYEKKKNKALIKHIGGNIEFNKPLKEFIEDEEFKKYYPHLTKKDKTKKRVKFINLEKQYKKYYDM